MESQFPFAVVWDLDGTILDTEPINDNAINDVLAEFNAHAGAYSVSDH
jgi:beta-phosphoglucomutase-like phosphatase (HAD superfamily)